MLKIIKFEDGRYGLQNQWTGIILPRQFRTKYGARRYIRKASRNLSKAIANINRSMSKYDTP